MSHYPQIRLKVLTGFDIVQSVSHTINVLEEMVIVNIYHKKKLDES